MANCSLGEAVVILLCFHETVTVPPEPRAKGGGQKGTGGEGAADGIKKSPPSVAGRRGLRFEIPLSPFTRLPAEIKLYITLLLISTPLFRPRGVLALFLATSPVGAKSRTARGR